MTEMTTEFARVDINIGDQSWDDFIEYVVATATGHWTAFERVDKGDVILESHFARIAVTREGDFGVIRLLLSETPRLNSEYLCKKVSGNFIKLYLHDGKGVVPIPTRDKRSRGFVPGRHYGIQF